MAKQPAQPFQKLVRLNYQDGMFLTAETSTLEQNFFLNLLRNMNMALFTPGVVYGLQLEKNDSKSIKVYPGVALDYLGRQLTWPAGTPLGPVAVMVTNLPASGPGNYTYTVTLTFQHVPDSVGGTPPTGEQPPDAYALLPLFSFVNPLPPNNSDVVLGTISVTVDQNGSFTVTNVVSKPKAATIRLKGATTAASPTADVSKGGALHAPGFFGSPGIFSGTATLKPPPMGQTVAIKTVNYRSDGNTAFDANPRILLTVEAGSLQVFATSVTAVNQAQFTIQAMLVPTGKDPQWPDSLTVNWLAWDHPT